MARAVSAKWLFWTAGFALLPTWLLQQPNPDWRLLSWLLALEVVALSLCAVYFLGGRPWLTHFAFSICLILTTVPWPRLPEQLITQGLMRATATLTVVSLKFFHIPALRHGSLIEVPTGLVGIDGACSGIRSLQAKGLAIPFHAWEFDYQGESAHVFFCLWQDGSNGSEAPGIRRRWWTRLARVKSVLLGERNLAQQVLEVVIFGPATLEEAEATFRRQTETLIRTWT